MNLWRRRPTNMVRTEQLGLAGTAAPRYKYDRIGAQSPNNFYRAPYPLKQPWQTFILALLTTLSRGPIIIAARIVITGITGSHCCLYASFSFDYAPTACSISGSAGGLRSGVQAVAVAVRSGSNSSSRRRKSSDSVVSVIAGGGGGRRAVAVAVAVKAAV